MDYDEAIRDAAKAIMSERDGAPWDGPTTQYDEDLARAAAPILMEYGARLMREAGMLKANELFKSTEVFAMLYNIDPAAIVKEAVK